MVLWLRICLAVQRRPVQSLVQEEPACCRAPGTMTAEPARALELQLLKPTAPEPVLGSREARVPATGPEQPKINE